MSGYIPLPAPPTSLYMLTSPPSPTPAIPYTAPPPEPGLSAVTAPITWPDPSALVGAPVVPPPLYVSPALGPEPSPSLLVAGIEAYTANIESKERADLGVVPPMFRPFAKEFPIVPILMVAGIVYVLVKA